MVLACRARQVAAVPAAPPLRQEGVVADLLRGHEAREPRETAFVGALGGKQGKADALLVMGRHAAHVGAVESLVAAGPRHLAADPAEKGERAEDERAGRRESTPYIYIYIKCRCGVGATPATRSRSHGKSGYSDADVRCTRRPIQYGCSSEKIGCMNG